MLNIKEVIENKHMLSVVERFGQIWRRYKGDDVLQLLDFETHLIQSDWTDQVGYKFSFRSSRWRAPISEEEVHTYAKNIASQFASSCLDTKIKTFVVETDHLKRVYYGAEVQMICSSYSIGD